MTNYLQEVGYRTALWFVSTISTYGLCFHHKEVAVFTALQVEAFLSRGYSTYFIATTITEVLDVYLRMCSFLTAHVALFMLCVHLYNYLSPALFWDEHHKLGRHISTGLAVLVASSLTLHWFIIPVAWYFFTQFQNALAAQSFSVHFEVRLVDCFNFYQSVYAAYVQLLAFFAAALVVTTSKRLKALHHQRTLCYLFILIATGMLDPADVFSQAAFFIGAVLAYEVLMVLVVVYLLASLPNAKCSRARSTC